MNAHDMLDYALGQAGPEDLDARERQLALDPAAFERAGRLRNSIEALLDDGQDPEPPLGLADRTLAHVGTHAENRFRLDWLPRRVPFRAADFAVAATVFLAGLLTLAPAVVRMRAQMETTRCMSQLQQIGMGLMSYSVNHGHYPKPPRDHPAGYFGMQLIKDDALEHPSVLVCPSRRPHERLRSLAQVGEFDQLLRKAPKQCQEMLETIYAYQAGYRAKASGATPLRARPTSVIPLLADGPPLDEHGGVRPGNSPNHGGGGQNVLYTDNHVEWLRHRRTALDEDIYLNKFRRVDLGTDSSDVALVPACWRMGD